MGTALKDIPQEWLYPASLTEATELQKQLAEKVRCEDDYGDVQVVAGVDVSANWHDPEEMVYASVVTLSYPGLEKLEAAHAVAKASMPYVPGFLAFREVPVLLEAYRKLKREPDLIFVDGHGISHPRGLGIASHLGVLLDMPTIGVAKKILIGRPEGELDTVPGSEVPLVWKGREIAHVLRSKARCNPLYVAPGHRVSIPSASEWVKRCLRGYRLPEPTRMAHEEANVCRRLETPVSR